MIALRPTSAGSSSSRSDRALRDLARKRGLEAVTSDVFARELKAAIKEGKKRRELDKRTETPTGLEVDLWDEMFRSKP